MSIPQNNKINKYIVSIAHIAYKNEWYEQIFETTLQGNPGCPAPHPVGFL